MSSPQLSANSPNNADAVDFLSVFGVKHQLPHLLSQIFDHLDGKDLTAICCVNKTWKKVLISDGKANCRRMEYLKGIRQMKKQLGQENWPIKRGSVEARPEKRKAFGNIQNVKPDGVAPAAATPGQVPSPSSSNPPTPTDNSNLISSTNTNVKNGISSQITTRSMVSKNSIISFERRKRPQKRSIVQSSQAKDSVTSPRKVKIVPTDENSSKHKAVNKSSQLPSPRKSTRHSRTSLGSRISILHLKRL